MIGLARRYPLVLVVLAGAVATGAAVLAGWPAGARWIATTAAIGVAAVEAVQMFRDLHNGRWGLDVLAILAIVSTAVLGDYWAMLVVALMMTGGKALEDYASNRAQDRLRALLTRMPRIAHRIERGGIPVDVPAEQVVAGDLLLVRPGELVPVDGVLTDDEADLDESSLTGESLPVTHSRGDLILSGSVNGAWAVRLKASAAAADSQYQQIVRMVESAAGSRSRFVRLADRFAIPFTLVALAIAALAWFGSGEPARFAEVLVVATPCPLLIAAPVAFVAGMGRAAKDGVVIKSGESLERLARVRTVAFDKTGTLTRGRPEVDRVDLLAQFSEGEVLALAAAVEAESVHVLAQAIVRAAAERGAPTRAVDDVEEVTAHGMRAGWEGHDVTVGKATFAGAVAASLDVGETAVYVGVDGSPVGRIVLRDELRPDAPATIAALRELGVTDVMMLTGDAAPTARHVAEALGIADVRAGLLPADKVAAVSEVPHPPVIMVGDGVNDAPVLAAADLGVAMGARGATAASETADVVVLADEISRVAEVVATAQRTVTIARQSIAIGIGLSVVFMLVAATGVLPAIAGALIQEGIDVATILNGLRAGRQARSRVGGHAPKVASTWKRT